MKKIKLDTAKLQLKKSTIVALNEGQMQKVVGGDTGPCTSYPCGGGDSQIPNCGWTEVTNGCATGGCGTNGGNTCNTWCEPHISPRTQPGYPGC